MDSVEALGLIDFMRQIFWEETLKNKGWRQTRFRWEGNFRHGGSVEEGTRERAGETDVCSWSQINDAKVKGWEQSSFRRLSILLFPSYLKPEMHGNTECGGAGAGRIAVAKTNSKFSTFKKHIFTALSWELGLEISICLCWGLTTFSNSFYRFLCKKSAMFSCLLEITCTLVFFEFCSGDQDWKRCFIVCSLSLSLLFFSSHTSLFFFSPSPLSLKAIFPNVHFLSLVWMLFRLKVKNTILVIV